VTDCTVYKTERQKLLVKIYQKQHARDSCCLKIYFMWLGRGSVWFHI